MAQTAVASPTIETLANLPKQPISLIALKSRAARDFSGPNQSVIFKAFGALNGSDILPAFSASVDAPFHGDRRHGKSSVTTFRSRGRAAP
jgi:hypothetical protein